MVEESAPAARWGIRVWTAIGLVLLGVGLVFATSQVSVIITAAVLALFPAALLDPVASRLRKTRIPDALISAVLLLLLLAAIAGVFAFITVALLNQWQQIADSVTSGLDQFDQAIDWSTFPGEFQGVSDLVTQAGGAILEGGLLAQGAGAVSSVATGALLLVVVLFFYLKDGRRIWNGFLEFVPGRHQGRVDLVATQAFWTVGAYFRAQLFVALIDAVFIGIGLWIVGIPLVLPLAVLIFIGGLFPIVGAVATGAVAVVVALADQGLVAALIVLGIVLLVQQVESNVLEPYIQGRTISLHPLVIILVVTGGGILMGILGAFLAVPAAAVIARIVDNLRGRPFPAGPGSEPKEDEEEDNETRDDDVGRVG